MRPRSSGAVLALPAAHLARQALQDPARTALSSAHAVAGRRRWPDRPLPGTGRRPAQGGAPARHCPPRRRLETGGGRLSKSVHARPRASATSGCARSTRSTPSAWSRSRRRNSATCATPSRARPPDGRASSAGPRASFPKLDEKYKALKEQIRTRLRDRLARDGRAAGAKG